MTEELKQKAKESSTNYVQQLVDHSRTIENDLLLQCQLRQSHQDGYIAGATEATKELQEEIKACKFAMTMSEKVEKQLREQIEKMKCCANCKHSRTDYEHCRTNKLEKWELIEK